MIDDILQMKFTTLNELNVFLMLHSGGRYREWRAQSYIVWLNGRQWLLHARQHGHFRK